MVVIDTCINCGRTVPTIDNICKQCFTIDQENCVIQKHKPTDQFSNENFAINSITGKSNIIVPNDPLAQTFLEY